MKIGFIGAGKMAQALARGLVHSGKYDASKIIASCPKKDYKLLEECQKIGINTTNDNTEVARYADSIIVAVKPMYVSKVISEVAPIVRRDHLFISIALGITIRYMETLLPAKTRVVRVMPNTPALVSAGASAYSMGSACLDGDSQTVEELLKTVGYAVEVPEVYIDPVTGLSGSGPSYVFAMIEGLADGGVKQGLPRDLALQLAAHTFHGAAKMVLETGEHPAILKEAVQSPGGSTVYGIHELEKGALRGVIVNAVEAATKRSRSTGDNLLPKTEKSEDEENGDKKKKKQKSEDQ